MSGNAGNLKVNIGADTRELSRGVARAKNMLRGLARVAKASSVAAGASFVAASAGLAAMTKSGLSYVDSQAKLARSVDGTIDGMRALQLAGGDAGAALADVNGAAQMMGKRLSEAARDGFGPTHDALQMLGLSARELMDLDVDARFIAIADRVNALGLSAQDAAGIMRDFGIRSNEVSLLLLQGSDAIRKARGEVQAFGMSMDAAGAGAVERANDAMSRIGLVFEGMRNQLAIGLAPALETVAVNFTGMAQAGGPLQDGIAMLVASFSDLAAAVLNPSFVEAVALFGSTLAGAVAGLASGVVILAQNAEIAGAAMVALGAAMVFFSGPIGWAIAAVAGGVFLLSTRLMQSKDAATGAAEAELALHLALGEVDRSNAAAVASGEALIGTHIDQARAAIEAAKAEYVLARAEASRAVQQAKMRRENMPGNFFAADDIEHAEDDLAGVDEYYEEEIAKREAQLERYQKTLEGFKRSQYPTQGTRGAPAAGTPDGAPVGDPLGVTKLDEDLKKLILTIDPAAAKTEKLARAKAILDKALAAGLLTQEQYDQRLRQVDASLDGVAQKAPAAAAGVKAMTKEAKEARTYMDEWSDGMNNALHSLVNNIDSGKDALRAFAIEAIKLFAIRGISSLLGGSGWMSAPLFSRAGAAAKIAAPGAGLAKPSVRVSASSKVSLGGAAPAGVSLVYAPNIDARGASVEAVQELSARLDADAVRFDSRVQVAIARARVERKI